MAAMFQLAELTQLNDCFRPLSQRGGARAYFLRIAAYSGDVAAFLRRYYEAARRSGVIIDGRIPHSILLEMLTDEGSGTMMVGEKK